MRSFMGLACISHKCDLKIFFNGYARCLHAYLYENELEVHLRFGNHLVSKSVKCENSCEAQHVTDRILCQDKDLWNGLLLGYIKSGYFETAFHLYEKMQEKHVDPNSHTLVALLKACTVLKELERGHLVRNQIIHLGLEKDLIVGTALVGMLGKFGWLEDAQQVFNNLWTRNVVSWNALIAGYLEHGDGREALSCFVQMQLEGMSPNAVTFVCSLKACISIGSMNAGKQLYMEVVKRGLEVNIFVGSIVVDMFGKFGSVSEAQETLEQLQGKDIVPWNAMITCYIDNGYGNEALACFEQMQLRGISPNSVTCICSLKACGMVRAIERGQQLFNCFIIHGLESSPCIGGAAIDMFCKCGLLAEAHEVLSKLPVRDVVVWSVLIAGYAEYGLASEALHCFKLMQLEGISGDAVTYVYAIKACGMIGATEIGWLTCSESTIKGWDTDSVVASALVGMLGNFGFLAEAQAVLLDLPVRDVVSWNSLITVFAEHGYYNEVLMCLELMHSEKVSADDVTLLCGLKACTITRAIEAGHQLYIEITKKGLGSHLFVNNALIDLFGKCGFLGEAQQVFDNLPGRDIISWNALLSAYVEHGCNEEVLDSFKQMQLHAISPNGVSYFCSLEACANMQAIEEGHRIYMEILKKGIEDHTMLGTTLLDLFCKCDSLAEAQVVLDKMPMLSVVSWNVLIDGYAEHGLAEKALDCFQEMQLDQVSPDETTFVSIMKVCFGMWSGEGRQVHIEATKRGLENDNFVASMLVNMYMKCGALSEACIVFNSLPIQDNVLWNTLITGYADHGLCEEVLNCSRQMQLKGVPLDSVTYACSLLACTRTGIIEEGQNTLSEMVKRGLESDMYVGTMLVDMFAKCGSPREAAAIFDKLQARSLASWNVLVGGYCEHGLNKDALHRFEQMQLQGYSPNAVTYICSLKACCNVGATEKGRTIHADIARRGLETDSLVGGALVNMYASVGSLSEAQVVFNKLSLRTVASWSAIMKGYAVNQEGDTALECFYDMQVEGVKPDIVAFTCLLAACSHTSLVSKGQDCFLTMLNQKIELKKDHYICIVDLLARSGHTHEAERLMKTMQCQPSVEMWTSLLSACKTYGDLQLGHTCFQRLVQMNFNDPGAYLMLQDKD